MKMLALPVRAIAKFHLSKPTLDSEPGHPSVFIALYLQELNIISIISKCYEIQYMDLGLSSDVMWFRRRVHPQEMGKNENSNQE